MRVRRGALKDVFTDGGRSVVMVSEQVLVLSELASSILDAVPPGGDIDLDEVTARVEAEYGAPEPPDTADELILEQVHDLAAHHVLVLEDPAITPLSSTTSPAAVDALRAALRHILSCGSSPWRLPQGVAAMEFVAAASQHHVVSFLDRHSKLLALPPDAAAPLRAAAGQRAAAVEILSSDLATAADALDRSGIRVLALKGLALAYQAYGDLAARGAGDLDLLVSPDDLERAHEVLTSLHWSHDPLYPHPSGAWAWRHLVRTGHEMTLTSATSTIDLHWHLTGARDTFPRFDTLWERRTELSIGERRVATLSQYDALAHSAGHAARDQWRWMRSLVDVHALASRTDTWHQVDRPLRRDQLLTLGLAARMFGVPPASPLVVQEGVGRTDQVWSEVLRRQATTAAAHEMWNPTLGATLVSTLRTMRRTDAGPRDVARQLAVSLLPPWQTAGDSTPRAWVAVPRGVCRRVVRAVKRLTAGR